MKSMVFVAFEGSEGPDNGGDFVGYREYDCTRKKGSAPHPMFCST